MQRGSRTDSKIMTKERMVGFKYQGTKCLGRGGHEERERLHANFEKRSTTNNVLRHLVHCQMHLMTAKIQVVIHRVQ